MHAMDRKGEMRDRDTEQEMEQETKIQHMI